MTARLPEASLITIPPSNTDRSELRGNGRPSNSGGAGPDTSPHLTLRALITTREAGVIIGKGGDTVAKIRQATHTQAGVSSAVPGNHDRILSISGGLQGVSEAYHRVATAILESPVASTFPGAPPSPTATTAVIRLLVTHNLMGSIIGKQGSQIKQIQETSKAQMLATKELLPQSTERIVEVQGSPDSIQAAVYEIGQRVMGDWERAQGSVPYEPGALSPDGMGATSPSRPLSGGYAYGGGSNRRPSAGSPYGNSGYRKRDPSGPHSPADGRPRGNSVGGAGPPSASLPAENLRTQSVSIPSDMVGCIIGKGGAKINEIRRFSGSKISIAKVPCEETGERTITITGTPDANEVALSLLYNQLEREKQRRVPSVEDEQI